MVSSRCWAEPGPEACQCSSRAIPTRVLGWTLLIVSGRSWADGQSSRVVRCLPWNRSKRRRSPKMIEAAALIIGVLVALVLISYVIEALRSVPEPSQHLAWAPDIPVRYVDVDGSRVRYIVAGEGPRLVLLHTL